MKATCATCGQEFERGTVMQATDALWWHDAAEHRGWPEVGTVQQLPGPDWHRQALDAIRSLAVIGKPFVISQVIEYGVPEAPKPRTDWARVQREAEGLGWIVPTGRLGHSVRPKTKGSPVTEWVGTDVARRAA